MPLGKLKAYYTKGGKRLEYIFTDEKGRFVVEVERNRKRKRRLCKSLQEAKHYAANVGLLFPAKPRKAGPKHNEDLTLRDLCDRYRAEDELKNVGADNHRRSEEHLCRILGDSLPLRDINHALIPVYLSQRLQERSGRNGKPLSPKSANDDVRRLHKLLVNAVRDGLLPRNPIAKWEPLDESAGRTRWLHQDEEDRLMAEVDEEFGRLIQIAILSGMRKMEQLTCKREQILWESNSIYLPKTKNREARHIPMGRRLAEAVRAQLELGTDWLCPNRSRTNRWLPRNVNRYFDKACIRAGIEDFCWHDLRRTYCSRLAMRGAPIKTIKTLAGHKRIETTEIYAHLSPSHLQEAAFLLD